MYNKTAETGCDLWWQKRVISITTATWGKKRKFCLCVCYGKNGSTITTAAILKDEKNGIEKLGDISFPQSIFYRNKIKYLQGSLLLLLLHLLRKAKLCLIYSNFSDFMQKLLCLKLRAHRVRELEGENKLRKMGRCWKSYREQETFLSYFFMNV